MNECGIFPIILSISMLVTLIVLMIERYDPNQDKTKPWRDFFGFIHVPENYYEDQREAYHEYLEKTFSDNKCFDNALDIDDYKSLEDLNREQEDDGKYFVICNREAEELFKGYSLATSKSDLDALLPKITEASDYDVFVPLAELKTLLNTIVNNKPPIDLGYLPATRRLVRDSYYHSVK